MIKQNSNQNVKVEKMVVFYHYHYKFDFGNFFSCPVKLLKYLKLKFSSKFNFHVTIIKAIFKAWLKSFIRF